MADVSALPVADWGSLTTSFGQGQASANQANASAGLARQQTQNAQTANQTGQMQNQLMAARMPVIMKALQDFGTSSDNSGAASNPAPSSTGAAANPAPNADSSADTSSPETSWYNPAQIDAGLRQRYFVNPAGTPQEVKQIIQAGVSGDPGLLESAKAQREYGVQQRLAQSNYDSSNLYDAMTSVSNAPQGQALDALSALAPSTAAKIKQMIPDGADEDAAARAYAAHVSGAVHLYTGRKVTPRADGTYVDEQTGQPVPGVEKSGLSEDQWAGLAKAGSELVPVKNSDGSESQVPRWRTPGQNASSLAQWVMQVAAKGGVPGAQPTVSGAPVAAAHAAATKATAGAQTTNPTAPSAAGTAPSATGAPLVQKALQDSSFRDSSAPGQIKPTSGTSQSTVGKGLADTYVEQRKEAQQTFSDNAGAAAQALQNFKAAQAILGAPDGSHMSRMTGVPGTLAAELSRLGYGTETADKRAEAAKYLTNGALQGLKQTYGAKPAMFDVKVNLEQAFPDVKTMGIGAVQNLIAENIRNAQYIRDSATRGSQYLAAGNRPSDFNSWNEKYFSRAEAVNDKGPASSSPKYTDAQVQKWAKTHGYSIAGAKKFLGVQ